MNVVHLKKGDEGKQGETTTTRKVRKDKGVARESTAAKLANIQMPKDIDRLVLADKGHQLHFDFVSDAGPIANVVDDVNLSNNMDTPEITVEATA